jgi:hypothetical protein
LSDQIEVKSYSPTAYAVPYTGQQYAKLYTFYTYQYETMLDLVGSN